MFYTFGASSWTERILKGCVIDGLIYRDISLVSIDDKASVFISFNLEQNYPNPFNPITTISFSLPKSRYIELKVLDVLGNEVAVLLNEYKSAGGHKVEFNAVETFHGSSLPSGIYFYQLKAGNFIQTKKLVLLR